MANLRGSCLCGGVTFEILEEFERVAYCHCASCKKISGGVGTVSGRVRSEAIRILAGDELLRSFQPDEGSAKTFCSVCGSNLFGGGWPESRHASVRLSGLDTFFDRRPEAHIFVRSVAPWETLPEDGLTRFETRPG
ncbi:MAG: GFA family protein [Actinomycetota bacterium]|nr:GFA family protein [Actinomycetota bacterium]